MKYLTSTKHDLVSDSPRLIHKSSKSSIVDKSHDNGFTLMNHLLLISNYLMLRLLVDFLIVFFKGAQPFPMEMLLR
jgi:hypothetical protein